MATRLHPPKMMLTFRLRDDVAEHWLYRAPASVCNTCACKAAWTSSSQGRLVGRSFHVEELERVRAYDDTPSCQQAMRKRGVWVEPLFAEAGGRPQPSPLPTCRRAHAP